MFRTNQLPKLFIAGLLLLADMALDPTLMAGEQVKTLASQIKSAQDPEIDFDDSMANRLGETAHGYVRGTRHVYGWHAER
jgi:hypothetical protein